MQCRFGARCNKFAQGTCTYKHSENSSGREQSFEPSQRKFNQPKNEQPCKFGNRCNTFALGKCPFKHDQSMDPSSQPQSFQPNKGFSLPKHEQPCKFGSRCNNFALGKCTFKHDQSNAPSSQPQSFPNKAFILPKNEQPCRFGERCNLLPLGKCPFKHQNSMVPSFQSSNLPLQRPRENQDTSQSFKQIFATICTDFLLNKSQNGQCGKLHEYSLNKNIKKIFQVDNSKVLKCFIFQYYQQDEQPIYAILTEGRIVFGQLLNLAKQSGMEHINNSAMIFKRCYEKDIALQGQMIEDFYLTYSLSQEYPRIDIIVLKGSSNLHIGLINKGIIQSFGINKHILGVAYIKNSLLISFQDRTRILLNFDPHTLGFQEAACPITHHLSNLKTYFKKVYNSEIAVGILQEKALCFLNERLETNIIQLQEKVKDVFITQYEGAPLAFALTQKQVFAINLLTFQKKSLLQGGLGHGLQFTSMTHTLNQLFLSIDNWGILIYNMNAFDSPTGLLSLGQRQWKLQSDDRGNLSLISTEMTGYASWWIFKVRRH